MQTTIRRKLYDVLPFDCTDVLRVSFYCFILCCAKKKGISELDAFETVLLIIFAFDVLTVDSSPPFVQSSCVCMTFCCKTLGRPVFFLCGGPSFGVEGLHLLVSSSVHFVR